MTGGTRTHTAGNITILGETFAWKVPYIHTDVNLGFAWWFGLFLHVRSDHSRTAPSVLCSLPVVTCVRQTKQGQDSLWHFLCLFCEKDWKTM